MKYPVLRAWAVVVIVVSSAPAADHLTGLPGSKLAEVRRAVAAEMAATHAPGMTVAIGRDLRLAWSDGFGYADLENQVPATADTVYRIASVSKPITAVAAMQLVEKERLDLDVPIQTYVPSFPEKPWPITARQLLSHLSGIRHYSSLSEAGSTRHYTNLLEPLKIFAQDALVFEPGTHYLYSTYGYCLLGAAIEEASGERFTAYVQAHVFAPAHMEHIRSDDVYAVIPHRAHGYRLAPDGTIQNCMLADTSNKIPGGGWVATSSDLVRFGIAFERGKLVGKKATEEMLTPVRTKDGKLIPYGLGWNLFERDGVRWAGHSGSQPGASAFLLLSPTDGLAVAILANLEGVELGPLSMRLAGIVLGPN